MRRLQGRVAVVTGAAQGIGQAVALALAAAGCRLALVDLKADGLAATAAAVERLGARATIHQADVASAAAMHAVADQVAAAHGAVHLLVNNAGVALGGPFTDYNLADLEWIVAVNLWGVLHGCQAFLPFLRQADEAHIVTVSSAFGLLGVPDKSAYCATKFAIRGFSEALRAELAPIGIGVTCVFPGAVDTGLVREGRTTDPAKRAQEAVFVANRSLGAERVAARIVRAIRRNQGRVLIGRDSWAIELATRLGPGFTNWLVGRLAPRLPFV